MFINLKELMNDLEQYKAHTKEDENGTVIEWESLEAHTQLCQKYYLRLIEEKGLEEIFEKFEREYLNQAGDAARRLFHEMRDNVITFHDVGKINPNYQKDRLKNYGAEENNAFRPEGSRHSGVSAIFYVNHYYSKIMELEDKTDRNLMKEYLLCNSYVIARHHSGLVDFETYLNHLGGGTEREVIELLEEGAETAYKEDFVLRGEKVERMSASVLERMTKKSTEESIARYIYVKMLYSLLVASDHYAASEYDNEMEMKEVGNLGEIETFIEVFQQTEVSKKIQEYKETKYPQGVNWKEIKEINELRSELYLDAEKKLKENIDEDIFYLEAPTGSGKSNTAFNLSFQLIKNDAALRKIYYIYPFNTLVEQNLESLEKVFGGNESLMKKIAVVNSVTPIKRRNENGEENEAYYQRALFDRQFLNYPVILSTHVSIFDTMFGNSKESVYAFHQLAGSVIVLDEIQSYKNKIWAEMILYLKVLARFLNMKIIIMSATLPDLEVLTGNSKDTVRLIDDRDKYFSHPCFRNRVQTNYDLLNCDCDELFIHVAEMSKVKKKILVEFIKKRTAEEFFRRIIEEPDIEANIYYMAGDDSIIERKKILQKVKEDERAILLATQVIEAGVDIDMDVGYKNIAKFDSEEQFMGRINRSCKREGTVYFFKLDNPKRVYGEDIRLNTGFTVESEEMRAILDNKAFDQYYGKILAVLQRNYNQSSGERGLKCFIHEQIGALDFRGVKERMRLIDEDKWSMSVYLARNLENEGIDGHEIWKQYRTLLCDNGMSYAQKKIKLSDITSKMNYFIYQIKKNPDLMYNDQIGEIYYIEDGEKYFENGKLNRRKIQGEVGEFVDFI